MYRTVSLFYPNEWRKCSKSSSFNWYLCSKIYLDEQTGLYVAEIGKNVKFYDQTTGETLTPSLEKTLLVLENQLGYTDVLKDKRFAGSASLEKCSGVDPLCSEATFKFKKDALRVVKESPIINYSKRHYIAISSKIPDFPTPKEIDEVLRDFPEKYVSLVLQNYVKEYETKISQE